ncbi:MAG: hypothetical protein DRI77_11960 [Chloroflexi bacterium]|nr:MAG: hypothetical protein DRI77_11960 [Chloroflexota bacterium]
MEIPKVVWIAGGVAVCTAIVVGVWFFLNAQKINLTRSKSLGQKPEWMGTMPPPETVAATQANGEGITLYDHDSGEHVAATFVEQIEDILHTQLGADPALAAMNVDLGTAPDGGLEIWVNGERYTEVNLIPDERLRQAIRQAVKKWEQEN